MPLEQCYPFNLTSLTSLAFDCFALDKTASKYFGFAELISGLALTLVVWTVADLRYKFRIDTASLPVRGASLVITSIVGVLTLLTDYWRTSQSRVPAGGWLTPESWQLLLGGVFFLVLVVWFWLAFFRPARFSRWNSAKFARSVEAYLLRGSPSELPIIGDELASSISRIVSHAPVNLSENNITKTQLHALRLLMAMGSPKFCRAVVERSPRLIINLFNAVSDQNKYSDEIKIIAKNLVTAAIENRNSFLYSEQDFYTSGLEGITRPVTKALCQCPELVRHIDTLLNPDYSRRAPWDIDQWNAYFRLVLEAFTTHVEALPAPKPYSLRLAYPKIERIYFDLTENLELKELRNNDDLYLRLRTLETFIKGMVIVLDDLAQQGKSYVEHAPQDIAKLIFNLIKAASSVRKPRKVSKKIQHSMIWEDILNSSELHTDTGRIILKQIHFMLLNSIKKSPNLDSVRLLGYCLNVMGFKPPEENEEFGSTWRDLHIELISWVKREIASLLNKYPRMARECFVDGMSYDEQNSRLKIHYVWEDGSEDYYEYLDVDPCPVTNPE
ncbi:hypothetical protein [Brenneria goodwinii]|uniref:hypothetical protein n=1 Tax=Brenneria goodwinii TaxID=1109412 RepID=UPI0036F0EC4F